MKNGKKIIVTLAAALFLSTSVGHAQSFNFKFKTRFHNPNNNRYVVRYNNGSSNYLKNMFESVIVKYSPIFDWDIDDQDNNEKPNKPEKPIEKPEKPEEPVEEPTKPEKPSKPTPQEPTEPAPKPQEPKPEEPSKPVERPDQNLSVEREVARLVNIERQKAGLAPLAFSEEISKVAEAKSQDMANKNYFSHTSPTYGDPFQMMRTFGIQFGYAGENIAKGYRSAASVMDGWMNSSGHRANILNSNFKKIGVGYIEVNGTTYWTQMFTD